MERLQKVIAHAGYCSRRKAESLIAAGRVKVNGRVVSEMGVLVDPGRDVIEIEGKRLAPETKAYCLLNKPSGVVTTVSDPQGRTTVLDLLPKSDARLYPVGRLDYETEGLLLLTNDGELAHRLTHPSFEVQKVYDVELFGRVTDEALRRLAAGVPLSDGVTAPAKVKLIERRADASRVEIGIHEGKNRQVRRMAEAVGFGVKRLRRVRFGPLALGRMQPGDYRALSRAEIASLEEAVGLRRRNGRTEI